MFLVVRRATPASTCRIRGVKGFKGNYLIYIYQMEQFTPDHIQQLMATLKRRKEQTAAATRKWRESHRDTVNAISKSYYNRHKQDAEWLKQTREKQRVYQQKRRAMKRSLATESEN